ncbi:MAG: hypothetical protein WC976_06865 [Caldisericia bacterium]
MSRSYKKNPFSGMTCAESEKAFKRVENRRARRVVRVLLKNDDERLPGEKAFGNPWNGPKDGKHRVDLNKFPKVVRK